MLSLIWISVEPRILSKEWLGLGKHHPSSFLPANRRMQNKSVPKPSPPISTAAGRFTRTNGISSARYLETRKPSAALNLNNVFRARGKARVVHVRIKTWQDEKRDRDDTRTSIPRRRGRRGNCTHGSMPERDRETELGQGTDDRIYSWVRAFLWHRGTLCNTHTARLCRSWKW